MFPHLTTELYLQQLNALEASNWTKMSPTMIEHGVAHSAHCISYIRLHKAALWYTTFSEVLHKVSYVPQLDHGCYL